MKILHVITSLSTGGAEHLMVDLLPRLKEYGNEVELCVFNGTQTPFFEEIVKSGIKVHALSEKSDYYNFKNILRLRRIMKGFDIVHTHNTAPQFFAAIAKHRKIKLYTTEHSTSTRRRNHKIFYLFDKWMYRQYDQIICISQVAYESLRKYIGFSYPMTVIENGIDVMKFENAVPVDLGLNDKIILTMVAGFRYEKDQATLIKSLLFLPEQYHVVLVGDGEKRLEIESLISEHQLESRVHLLGLRTDVPSILKSSNIVVMSSHREGLSLSNVEGMASGCPFVASDVDGLREVTKNAGVLFPHQDPKTLASIVKELISNENYRLSIIDKCQKKARMYDISLMVKRYNDFYNNNVKPI